jgi:hypothetical protein
MSTGSGIRGYYNTPLETYAWRTHLLRVVGDLDRILKGVRAGTYPGKVLDRPVGKVREVPRACSHCKQPTIFTTDRGRSVHPTCEGWIDTLTPEALMDLVFDIQRQIPIASFKESACLFDPARTLAALITTDSPSSPGTGSASPADTPSSGT